MANTLTGMIPVLYKSLSEVSRGLTGFIPAVRRDTSVARAALDQTVRVPIAPEGALESITPGAAPAASGTDSYNDYVDLSISKSYAYPILWNGEEQISVKGDSISYENYLGDQFKQAFNLFATTIDADIAGLWTNACRAYGTGGTTPFATTVADAAQVKKILDDQGAPGDRSIVVDTSAGVALRSLTGLNQVNAAGSDATLRNGIILPLFGQKIYESADVKTHTAGTASSATTSAAGFAVGVTSIALASAGTGTILANDIISFAGDDHKYMVKTGDADVSGGGTIVLAEPGLMQAIPASATAITVESTFTANYAFPRSAVILATRQPALPKNGDLAQDRTTIVDPLTGLAFEVAYYPQYRQNKIEISMAWGYGVVDARHTAVLLG